MKHKVEAIGFEFGGLKRWIICNTSNYKPFSGTSKQAVIIYDYRNRDDFDSSTLKREIEFVNAITGRKFTEKNLITWLEKNIPISPTTRIDKENKTSQSIYKILNKFQKRITNPIAMLQLEDFHEASKNKETASF